MEKGSNEQITAGEILSLDKVEISPHSLGQFAMRRAVGLVEAATIIKGHLAASVLIEYYDKGGKTWHFRDSEDPDMTYVVQEKRKARKKRFPYVLKTVLVQLRVG